MEIPSLSENDLHVWILPIPGDTTADRGELPPLRFEDFSAGVLDAGERERAERFRFPADRVRFALCRSTLRRLVGAYAGLDPAAVTFREGAHGKPYLATPASGRAVQFNLSHTRGMGVFAFALGREVGVDVEQERRAVNELELGRRVFTPAELDTLVPLGPEARRERFFSYWTAKEAFLKATGRGLSLDPRKVEAELPEDEQSDGMFRSLEPEVEAAPWRLRSFRRPGGFRISLACPAAIAAEAVRVIEVDTDFSGNN